MCLRVLSRFVCVATISVSAVFALGAAEPTLALYTLAGSPGSYGVADGVGAAAKFGSPAGIAVDPAGNVYVSEPAGGTIRKITAARVVTTFAGSVDQAGFADGAGQAARFSGTQGLAADASGNLYVADHWNNAIRKISPRGEVTTLAGSGSAGFVDGVGAAAKFNEPIGLAADVIGNIYVADRQNAAVRLISPTGVVTTLATDAQEPVAVAVDQAGVIYVATSRQTIGKIVGGHLVIIAGAAGQLEAVDGVGSAAHFGTVHSLVVGTDGNLYATDSYTSSLRKITPTGVVSTVPVTAERLSATDITGPLWIPLGLAMDGAGNFFVVDYGHRLIRTTATPVFATQPQSQVVPAGDSATLSVAVNWPTATYQWNLNGRPIPGATAARYTIEPMEPGKAGDYAVDVSNGAATLRSDVARLTLSSSVYPAPYAFRTLAGVAGEIGNRGGTAAKFSSPLGIGFDAAGNAYVADSGNGVIRRITPTGAVTTLAGKAGVTGNADGLGSAARFTSPGALAIDAAGTIYVGDSGAVRKISLSGAVTTLAGKVGTSGTADGLGAEARFNGIAGLAVDSIGNVFVTDLGNRTVRKISPGGAVTTLAGQAGVRGNFDGVGVASFASPVGIVVDATGTVYVSDAGNENIRKIAPNGETSKLAGQSGGQPGETDGVGGTASFNGPSAMAIDGTGTIYVADQGGASVRKVKADGAVTTWARSTTRGIGYLDGAQGVARFTVNGGLAVNRTGEVFFTEVILSVLRKIAANGVVSTVAGHSGITGSSDSSGLVELFNQPYAIAADAAGSVYVADTLNSTIRLIAPTGTGTLIGGRVTPQVDEGPANEYELHTPFGLTVAPDGVVYVADTGAQLIRKLGQDGKLSLVAGQVGAAALLDGVRDGALFSTPRGLAADAAGNVYVADAWNRAVRKINAAGEVTTLTRALLEPAGVVVDGGGTVYVVDASFASVFRLSADGTPVLFAGSGSPDYPGSDDGNGSAARFRKPQGIAIDGDGNLFVADTGNHTVRRITPGGTVTTVGGLAGAEGSADGTGSGARFRSPMSVAVDKAGMLYVADTGNSTVRVGRVSDAALASTRMVNIATRAYGGRDNAVTIGGFVIGGTGEKQVLVRAVGPSLTAQGLKETEIMPDPTVEVHDAVHGNRVIATNDNWIEIANRAEMEAATARVGASALLPTDTKSAALLLTLQPGVYSFVVKGRGDTSGVVLLEVYDADASGASATFANIATRALSTSGNGVTIGGFVLAGKTPKRVLLRAVGPTLSTQGLEAAAVLADPVIEVHDALRNNLIVAYADDWVEGGAEIVMGEEAARLGATPMDRSDLTSAALRTTLLPGVYSFVAKGKVNGTGIVLVEVYDAE